MIRDILKHNYFLTDFLNSVMNYHEHGFYIYFLQSLGDLNILVTEPLLNLFIVNNSYGYLLDFFDAYNI